MTPALAAPVPELPAQNLQDLKYLRQCLRLARGAARRGEVPVGAVAVASGRILATASNQVESRQDATAHAEMIVLRSASRRLASWRLSGVTLYCSLEPCPMCAGAALLARVDRVVYSAPDPRKGADRSAYDVLANPAGNHHPEVSSGLCVEESAALLQQFFARLRG